MYLQKCYSLRNVFLPSRVKILVQLGVVNPTRGSEVQYRLSENQYVIRRNIYYSHYSVYETKRCIVLP